MTVKNGVFSEQPGRGSFGKRRHRGTVARGAGDRDGAGGWRASRRSFYWESPVCFFRSRSLAEEHPESSGAQKRGWRDPRSAQGGERGEPSPGQGGAAPLPPAPPEAQGQVTGPLRALPTLSFLPFIYLNFYLLSIKTWERGAEGGRGELRRGFISK